VEVRISTHPNCGFLEIDEGKVDYLSKEKGSAAIFPAKQSRP
jgi:hypothetical protein